MPVTDKALKSQIEELLKGDGIHKHNRKTLTKALEEHFDTKLADKKDTIKKMIEDYVESRQVSDEDSDEEPIEKPKKRSRKDADSGSSKRAKKDNNGLKYPKGKQNSYAYFLSDVRATIKEENPKWGNTEILKEAADRWKNTSDKSKWQEMAEKDKKRYDTEMLEFKEKGGEPKTRKAKKSEEKDSGKKSRRSKSKLVEGAPKPAISAYLHFGNAVRIKLKEESSELNNKEVIGEIAKRWKEADEKTKEKYNAVAKKDKERYGEELAAFKEKYGEDAKVREGGTKRKSKKGKGSDDEGTGKKKKKKKDPNAPKRPTTAFFAWMNENRAEIKTQNPEAKLGELSKIAGELWKKLSAEEKGKYEKIAKKDKERYDEAMKSYVPPDNDNDDSDTPPKKKSKKAAPVAKKVAGKRGKKGQAINDNATSPDAPTKMHETKINHKHAQADGFINDNASSSDASSSASGSDSDSDSSSSSGSGSGSDSDSSASD